MGRGLVHKRYVRQKAIDRAHFIGSIRWFNSVTVDYFYSNDVDFDIDQWALRAASVHCCKCSCYSCRLPKGTPSRQQCRSDDSFEDQKIDIT